jgi:hypothetical protein
VRCTHSLVRALSRRYSPDFLAEQAAMGRDRHVTDFERCYSTLISYWQGTGHPERPLISEFDSEARLPEGSFLGGVVSRPESRQRRLWVECRYSHCAAGRQLCDPDATFKPR